jgi:anti-sigma factor RsiW
MDSSAHPADGDLRALLDGELPAAQRSEVEQHTTTCGSCRARLAALEFASQETAALLNLLPSAAPDLQVESIVARARRPRLRWGVIAAGLALLIATVAGATVGRPFVRAVIEQIRVVVHPAPPAPPPPPAQTPTPLGQLGIAFVPGPQMDVSFDAPQSAGTLHVVLADTAKLVIGPTAAVTYRVYPGGVIVHNRGSEASYEVLVPRLARHVRILVAGRVLFEKTGSSITVTAPAEQTGGYVFQLR